MTEKEAKTKLITLARSQVGYKEGSGNRTKYAEALDRIPGFYNGPKQGFAWCDVFVDWLFVESFGAETGRKMICQPKDSAGAGCYFSAMYYRQESRFHERNPEPGDQVFFSYAAGEVSHTGIVETVSGSGFTTIEGNSSDGVNRRSYQIGDGSVYGYGTPRWNLAASAPADPAEPVSGTDTEVPKARQTCRPELPVLREGDTGIEVERLQTLLIGRGYYCGGRRYGGREQADGEFGPATAVAVRDVQLAAKISRDGEVGPDTWTALITS